MNAVYKKVIKAIKKYDHIVILRHEVPDFDASGSQFGLKEWICGNFPNKKVYAMGHDHKIFSPKLYPANDKDVEISEPYLCLVVDTANLPRVDKKEYIDKADLTIKIDHHPNVEPFGDVYYVEDSASAACEIISEMLFGFKLKMPAMAAYYLYSGLVGDSGRFQYSSTSAKTFNIASRLMETGFDFLDIYNKMYLKSIEDIKVVKYLYNSFVITPSGVGYYHVSDAQLNELGIFREQIKAYVNLLAGYEEVKIWVQFSEDKDEQEYKWRVSIRSRGIKINDIAALHNGGGHDNASGCKCKTYEETMQLIDELDQLLKGE